MLSAQRVSPFEDTVALRATFEAWVQRFRYLLACVLSRAALGSTCGYSWFPALGARSTEGRTKTRRWKSWVPGGEPLYSRALEHRPFA